VKYSEADIEAQLVDLLGRQGLLPVKTEAGRSGHRLPAGFPDLLGFLPLPGSPFALVVLVELKTATGKLRKSQIEYHALLRAHGLTPLVVRDPQAALALIDEGRRLRRVLLPHIPTDTRS